MVLEHLKALSFHHDLGPGDVLGWHANPAQTSWHYLVGALLTGATALVYAGSPTYPRTDTLWSVAADSGVTCLGMPSGYLADSQRAGARPGERFDLGALRGVVTTGPTPPPAATEWAVANMGPDVQLGALLESAEACTMLAGPVPLLPVRSGVPTARFLGARVEALDARDPADGAPGTVGELTLTRAMPSLPLGFWEDPGSVHYHHAYFGTSKREWRSGGSVRILPDGGCVAVDE
ncbi:hypothetical protein J4H86_12035 [Spiractinospora alimapuensis]|uniref:hypothetical protein n=1 Tax=Spiractinospora alimapuensis TaxID=2820884 RepID=UPI001F212E2C|nr:hypothetical protein [Spiractinospora alimapuensis]QVQ54340.1 hypothetical protein J4H86_12035 [Spiractinospora alimapuensis]